MVAHAHNSLGAEGVMGESNSLIFPGEDLQRELQNTNEQPSIGRSPHIFYPSNRRHDESSKKSLQRQDGEQQSSSSSSQISSKYSDMNKAAALKKDTVKPRSRRTEQ